MEEKLKTLFEYQRFERNAHLDRLISKTENRHGRALSDDELMLVSAAGETGIEESPASVVCNHCNGSVPRSFTGLLGYTIYDCTCGWRTKYKGNEWIACYKPSIDGCP